MNTHGKTNAQRIGERIKLARVAEGYTQEVLAAELGIGIAAISKKERGEDAITAEQLARLATLLGKPADWFLEDVR